MHCWITCLLCKFFRYILDFKVIDPTEATFTLASAAISVAERLLTSAVTYTSPDIYHGSAHTVSLEIRDKTTGVKLTDIAWSVSAQNYQELAPVCIIIV